jgi:carbonic anhydrase/acetyltransferase-like protein (isoleucine patch superfamily)
MKVVILGAGGHARVLASILGMRGLPHRCGGEDEVGEGDWAVIGVGNLQTRMEMYAQFSRVIMNVIHPSAIVMSSIGDSSAAQIMAGAIIQPGCHIGANTLINTRAVIDHDSYIEPHCHVAPGAVLCGGVRLGEGSFVGAGATIIQGVSLEPGTFVPAGTLVVGPDDFRKPLVMVRRGRDVSAREREEAPLLKGSYDLPDQRLYPDAQPGCTAIDEGVAERPGADLRQDRGDSRGPRLHRQN